MDSLKADYREILQSIDRKTYWFDDDRYSGVFLPIPSKSWHTASKKIMLVGRETAGWNTQNGKNTIQNIIEKNESGETGTVIDEALSRYTNQFKRDADGDPKGSSTSKFLQYYFRLARKLGLPTGAILYANLFAWDYNGKSPLKRPADEQSLITDLSLKLLATQIKHTAPDAIIFASGINHVDNAIRQLFNQHFDGYVNECVIPKKLWEFRAAGARCFRIAHPRASYDHPQYRDEVIARLKLMPNKR